MAEKDSGAKKKVEEKSNDAKLLSVLEGINEQLERIADAMDEDVTCQKLDDIADCLVEIVNSCPTQIVERNRRLCQRVCDLNKALSESDKTQKR